MTSAAKRANRRAAPKPPRISQWSARATTRKNARAATARLISPEQTSAILTCPRVRRSWVSMYWSYSTSLPPGRAGEREAGGEGLGATVDTESEIRGRESDARYLTIDAGEGVFDPSQRGIGKAECGNGRVSIGMGKKRRNLWRIWRA